MKLANSPGQAAQVADYLRNLLNRSSSGEWHVSDAQALTAKQALVTALNLSEHGPAKEIKITHQSDGRHSRLGITCADGVEVNVVLNADTNTLRVIEGKELSAYQFGDSTVSEFYHDAFSTVRRPIEWSSATGQTRGETISIAPETPIAPAATKEEARLQEATKLFVQRNAERLSDLPNYKPEVRTPVISELKEALGIPADQFIAVNAQVTGAGIKVDVSQGGKVILESTYNKEKGAFSSFREYISSGIELLAEGTGLPDFRRQGARTKETVVQDTVQTINTLGRQLDRWDERYASLTLSDKSRAVKTEALRQALGLGDTAEIEVTHYYDALEIPAKDGLKLLAQMRYVPGSREVTDFYHADFAGYERPIQEAHTLELVLMPLNFNSSADDLFVLR